MSLHSHCLGFPRIGKDRELKWATERYWRGQSSADELAATAAELRQRHWQLQRDAGLATVTCGDFSLYDQMLDTAVALGAIPARFAGIEDPLEQFFAMARGNAEAAACEMTKWFNTNYHYLVPELAKNQSFQAAQLGTAAQVKEALQVKEGAPKAVLIGPITFLRLAKNAGGDNFSRLDLLPQLLPAYRDLLRQLAAAGADWVQLDEPALTLDLEPEWLQALEQATAALADAGPKLLLTTYFGGLGEALDLALSLPVHGLHLDALRGGDELERAAAKLPADKVLSAGVVNGRNIWRCDLEQSLTRLQPLADSLGDRLWVGSSCSLQHSPVDVAGEQALDDELCSWLAFATQKLTEIAVLAQALVDPDRDEVRQALADSSAAVSSRAQSTRVHKKAVADRLAKVGKTDLQRARPYAERASIQTESLQLPLFPTTTIGSFPQTSEIRSMRLKRRRGEIDEATYKEAMRAEIRTVIAQQEEIGLDVLVHGEPERNDMVEYFGELLDGMITTGNGWVQSYGSRCVKPPIIFGDVERADAMTVEWLQYSQSLTDKPVKGMLTGPVTILCWSFPREDAPLSLSAMQIALALRDEVTDLEEAGLKVIQIDEPAFREGMPLRHAEWPDYFAWAIDSFLLSSCGALDGTQIHSHMCYAEFNDIIAQIAALDADVISIETSRSNMELLDAFHDFKYPNEIGPGVYDIHSPRIPEKDWMHQLMQRATSLIEPKRLWLNPDCGLKTRRWEEVRPALKNMVATAKQLRDNS